jgi:predicted hydrocarbon binding protein
MEETAKLAPIMWKVSWMGMGELCKAFYKKYGEEALPIITEVMGQAGGELSKSLQQMMPGKSIKAIGEMYKKMGVEVLTLSDETLHFKMRQCPMGIEGTSKELCEAMMNWDKGMMSSFLGQEAEVKVVKTVAAGDKMCEVIESKK